MFPKDVNRNNVEKVEEVHLLKKESEQNLIFNDLSQKLKIMEGKSERQTNLRAHMMKF